MFSDLLSWLAALPKWQMFVAFWAVGVLRGLGYYVVGALVGARLHDARWSEARGKVQALGARSVVVTWPVYGLAGATQVINGAVRVPTAHFLAALVPLAGLWAVLQTIVGVALIEALMTQAAPYLVALLAVVAALRLAVHWRRRRADMVDARV